MGDDEFWYERTAYRKIPKSTCVDGLELHRGEKHACPGFRAHGAMFWWTVIFIPFGFTALVVFWYYRRGGYQRGYVTSFCAHYIRLFEPFLALFDFPIHTRFQILDLWLHLHQYHGLLLAWLEWCGVMSKDFHLFQLHFSDREEAIGMFQLTKMHRFCGSRMKTRQEKSNYDFCLESRMDTIHRAMYFVRVLMKHHCIYQNLPST